MSSSFNETVGKLGYEVVKRVGKEVLLKKEGKVATILILFNGEEKQISGSIKTNVLISTLDEISSQYAMFKEMQEDLKTFKQLSNYDILN